MNYITLDPEFLKQQYKIVRVSGLDKSVGYGYRYYFWVCGNGKRTVFFSSAGEVCVFRNALFTVDSVVGAQQDLKIYTIGVGADEMMIVSGRIKYRTGDSPWEDLGPITRDGVQPSDEDLDECLRSLRDEDEEVEIDLEGDWNDSGCDW